MISEKHTEPELQLSNRSSPLAAGVDSQTQPLVQQVKQVPYLPRSQGKSVDTLMPVNMQSSTANALARLDRQVGSVDEYVTDRLGYGTSTELHQYFSAEQVDACALAISNLEKKSGFIIGDQTGIGKGRVVAAMIRYAKQTGRTPIFLTKDTPLYADMVRDLNDIGMSGFKPFVTNSSLDLPLPDGRQLRTTSQTHKQELQALRKSGRLDSYDAIFTTYNQIQTVKGKETPRREFLRSFAANAILILDESHEAGGSQTERQSGNAPNRAEFARELIELADGVFYSSATYAKRPDVMDLYVKTDMRLAVKNMASLVGMIESGGVPMQQALATMLTEAGQYIRRERSFTGVSFDAVVSPVDRQVAEMLSLSMAAILEFDRIKQEAVKLLDKQYKAEAKAILGDNSTGGAGATSTNFTSIMHNLIDQSLLALKAETTVQKALELLRQPEPEKPVIALSSTMGSFIGQYAEMNALKPGYEINLSFGDLLKRYLDRSRDVLVGSPYGEKSRHRLTDEELGPAGVMEYERVLDLVAEADLSSLPISPIDYIKARLTQEGYRINEVTGRVDVVEYDSQGNATYQRRAESETNKAAAVRNVNAFNRGELDVLILNRSGSTGISLHASANFADQHRRHMIVAQPERDINQFMQMLGRIHRTGQVVTPNFTLLMADVPAEKRPGAVLAKKMASLNANTTAARSSGVSLDSVPDFMNEYGDQVVAELMANNPRLHYKLDKPLGGSEDELDTHNAISKVTGRIPLLPLAEQERIYNLIETEYTEFLQRQEAIGESILEAKSLDLDARTIARMEVVPADQEFESPFTSPVHLEVVDAKTSRKPVTTLQAINIVRQNLDLSVLENLDDHDLQGVVTHSSRVSEQVINQLRVSTEQYRQQELPKKTKQSAIDHFNDRLDRQFAQVQDTLSTFPVGEPVRIVTANNNVFYGVAARAWSRVEDGDNPTAPAIWRVQFLLTDPARELTLPLSRINTGRSNAINVMPQKNDWDGIDIYQVFDLRQGKNREERQIFTGNLLRAYDKFAGKLINYTDTNETICQGLLMPRGFDIEQSLQQQPVKMPRVKDAYQFLTQTTSGTGQLKTLDELLTIKGQKRGAGFVIQVPKAGDVGKQYFLDRDILAAAGSEFYSVGDRMECTVSQECIESVLETIIRGKGLSLAAFEQQDAAREMLGINLPQLEHSQWGEFEVDYMPRTSPVKEQACLPPERAFDTPAIKSIPTQPELVRLENQAINDLPPVMDGILAKQDGNLRQAEDPVTEANEVVEEEYLISQEGEFLVQIAPPEHKLQLTDLQPAIDATEQPQQLPLWVSEAEHSVCSPTLSDPAGNCRRDSSEAVKTISEDEKRPETQVEQVTQLESPKPAVGQILGPETQRLVQVLRHWYRLAQYLERPYLDRIARVANEVKKGQPMPQKALEVMKSDVQTYDQQLGEVVSASEKILKYLGQTVADGKRVFSGKNYQLSNASGNLLIQTKERGTILAATEREFQQVKLTESDIKVFCNFSQRIDQQLAVQKRKTLGL